MILEILVGGAVTYLVPQIRQRFLKRKYKLSELNHYDHGLVLPAIDDPDWVSKPGPCWTGSTCARQVMEMGKIRCCMDHGVTVSDMNLDHTWPAESGKFIEYARAVRRAVLDRMVQESTDLRWKRLEAVDKEHEIG